MAIKRISLVAVALLSSAAWALARPAQKVTDIMDTVRARAAKYALPANGILSSEDLAMYAIKEESFHPKDSFAPNFDDKPLVGRHFRVVLPVKNSFSTFGATWDYNASSEKLRVTERIAFWNAFSFLTDDRDFSSNVGLPNGLYIWRNNSDMGTERRVNGFGVPVLVHQVYLTSIAVGNYSAGGTNYILGQPHELMAEKIISSKEARKLAPHLHLIIEGEVVATKTGRAIYCGGEVGEATFDHPYEASETNCVISTRIERVAFEADGSNLIAEWKANASAAQH